MQQNKISHKTLVGTIFALAEMQDSLNETIVPGWKEKDTPYLRACHIELSEGLGHLDWPWWKKIEPNVGEYKTELIDALHFTLSEFLKRYKSFGRKELFSKLDEILNKQNASKQEFAGKDRIKCVEITIKSVVDLKWHDKILTHVLQLMYNEDMDLDEIVTRYAVKNALNFFRKGNGYKEGTYIKIWDGKEDNEAVLDMVMDRNEQDGFIELFSKDRSKFMYELDVMMIEKYGQIESVSAEDNVAAYKG